jgi:hypothetical protein
MKNLSREEWRDFHYPKHKKIPKKKTVDTYKLIDCFNEHAIVQGNYALCKFKQKQITSKTKIIPA